MTTQRARVAVIHPWFPQYREAFFELLRQRCADEAIDVDIYFGDSPPEWRERGDALTPKQAVHLPTRFVGVGSRTLGLKSLGPFRSRGPYDLVILEHAIRNLETYTILLSPRYFGKIAWWGHGRTYTAQSRAIAERSKRLLTRLARWFFAYTDAGAAYVAETGFDRDRITAVHNSIDTRELQSLVDSIADVEVEAFRELHGIRGRTALYIGGLDSSKRIDFLLTAAATAYKSDPSFRLLVAGNGSQRVLVESAASSAPWLIYFGSRFGREKAMLMRASSVLANPGRVGLVAVDSFAAQTPIVTTDWPFHAPEFEYLTDGVNAIIAPDSVQEFAQALLSYATPGTELDALKKGCGISAREYSLEAMVDNFVHGLLGALSLGPRQTQPS